MPYSVREGAKGASLKTHKQIKKKKKPVVLPRVCFASLCTFFHLWKSVKVCSALDSSEGKIRNTKSEGFI